MPKVTVIQVIYNGRRFIEPVFSAIFAQGFKDFEVVAVISGNDDGGKELLAQKFPQVKIIDPGYNIGFAAGHNLVFSQSASEFFQLVNPDLIMETDYIEKMLKAFDDEKVGAATGKLLRYDFENNRKTNIIDTTGVVIFKSGRARDRGQHEVDNHQYDSLTSVQAVSAAAAMYRRSAIVAVKMPFSPTTPSPLRRGRPSFAGGDAPRLSEDSLRSSPPFSAEGGSASGGQGGVPGEAGGGGGSYEFFDQDFHSYWEDVDLSWRMANAGWKNVFVPSAIAYHGRGAGSSKNGYADVAGFIKHHRQLSPHIRQLNYKNHIFMYIKNSKYLYPQFFVREFFMFFYILFFEPSTLKVLPEMFKLMPKMWGKRKYIKVCRRPSMV
jgi:GT2 family glycosyltransferase